MFRTLLDFTVNKHPMTPHVSPLTKSTMANITEELGMNVAFKLEVLVESGDPLCICRSSDIVGTAIENLEAKTVKMTLHRIKYRIRQEQTHQFPKKHHWLVNQGGYLLHGEKSTSIGNALHHAQDNVNCPADWRDLEQTKWVYYEQLSYEFESCPSEQICDSTCHTRTAVQRCTRISSVSLEYTFVYSSEDSVDIATGCLRSSTHLWQLLKAKDTNWKLLNY